MRFPVKGLKSNFPAGRLKLRFICGPFLSQRLCFSGKSGSIVRNERFSQALESGRARRSPLRIHSSWVRHNPEGGSINKRFKFRNSQAYLCRFLGQTGQPLIAGPRSQDLALH